MNKYWIHSFPDYPPPTTYELLNSYLYLYLYIFQARTDADKLHNKRQTSGKFGEHSTLLRKTVFTSLNTYTWLFSSYKGLLRWISWFWKSEPGVRLWTMTSFPGFRIKNIDVYKTINFRRQDSFIFEFTWSFVFRGQTGKLGNVHSFWIWKQI